ncbi:MAG: acetylornithine deacetylase [Alphaproteobacteria bacterium]|jgi:acetylornithine deacetylase|nr:acetylornithine deacetylase [Alphaproteobacteria bacterium]MDP6817697.1 acetylornithine deacetylase [Alphaproteobacteria bacterium]|tara:strand:+ start:1167 stop:2336 length:1170 start_codon:yes stop_codon:yes gene_type:complete
MPDKRYSSIEMIKRLVSFDTTSTASNLALINFVADYLAALGIDSHLIHDESGEKANLYATIGPRDVPGIVLSGHTDVVPVDGQAWDTDPFEVVEKENRLYGRGTSDMKSFIAIALAMAPDFATRDLKTPVHFALSFDEEVGCLGAPLMIRKMDQFGAKPRAVIVGEPTQMSVVNAHKGVYSFITTVKGLERHSSETHRGVNAIAYGAELVNFLTTVGEEMRDQQSDPESGFDPPFTTVHVGTMQGGTAQNIVPLNCIFSWEYRLMPGEDASDIRNRFQAHVERVVLPKMHAVDETTAIETEVRAVVPGLVPEDGSAAEALVLALARKNSTEVVAYGTEAGQFQEAGNQAVICGPGSIAQAHKPNEYIDLGEVRACEIFMRRLLDEVCAA